MSPITHLLISWSIANTANVNRRERALITLAGVIPDFDGAGLFLDIFQKGSEQPFQLWSQYHHILGHNIGFCIILTAVSLILSTKRLTSGLLVFISFHLHLVCDLLGSKGPDGFQWPIPYLLPFSNAWQLTWKHQWQLNAWPNFAITIVAILFILYRAWKHGTSPIEIISVKANSIFVGTLRKRFGDPCK